MGRKRGVPPNFNNIPRSGPLVTIDDSDHLSLLDRRILGALRKNPMSPEGLLRLFQNQYSLEQIWESLDDPTMKKYVYRKTRHFWAFLTEGQVKWLYFT